MTLTGTRGTVRTLIVAITLLGSFAAAQTAGARRPMSFMDVLSMRSVESTSVSPDGKWLLYGLRAPDWKEGKNFSDLYLVSVEAGLPSTRQMTFSRGKNESSPAWARDGKLFCFLSDRDAPSGSTAEQLYAMRPDGGEARRISDAKDGVTSFAFSRDGRWLAFAAGKPEGRQVWIVAVAAIDTESPRQLTRHETGIISWQFTPDSSRVLFVAPDSRQEQETQRIEKKFTATIRNAEKPPDHLWSLDLQSRAEIRLTSSREYSVSDVTVSKDGKRIGFRGTPGNRYQRTVLESKDFADLYMLDGSGKIERLTENGDIEESALSFSPDNTRIAFSAADGFKFFRNNRVYVRQAAGAEEFRKIGGDLDADVPVGIWSDDSRTIYFTTGTASTSQLFALSVDTGKVRQMTSEKGVLSVTREEDSRIWLIRYTDPVSPVNLYAVTSLDQIADRRSWKQLTDTNPQVKEIALGATETVQWKSTDGTTIEGVLVKPVGYEPGKRYPLVVQIHGGPAGANLLSFNADYGYYSHVYAAAGYACLLPNYRGSTNYGEKFKMEIAGDYFTKGYEDIMTGVDALIARGLADAGKLGVMGWSAGGHWSNWILTHTDRFKAISSGAGAVNWTSMYAQSDTQRQREYYYMGKPYDRFEHYWDVSPLKYIKNAKTPTLIHVMDGDPRVPRPQSEELHMALRQLGVPTEFLVYPGATHGITEPRNQLVKMASEFGWFEKYIRGTPTWFDWNHLLDTLKDQAAPGSDNEK
jgi:dipeptidyl aminopeptidase/acylaminoacyl peptidase